MVQAVAWTTSEALRSQFESVTGQSANAAFGSYVAQPIGGDLFVGVSNEIATYSGAAVLKTSDGSTFSEAHALDEQGIHDMQALVSDLWIPGSDPTEDWTLGNAYNRSAAGVWTKRRTLPNVLHGWGLYHDGATLLVAAGSHTGDSQTWRGRVLRSADDGQTWSAQIDVTDYRVYDVIPFAGKLYAVGQSAEQYPDGANLYISADGGDTWQIVDGVSPLRRPRLHVWGSRLIVSASSGVYEISAGGTATLRVGVQTLNQFNVLDSDGAYLYVLDASGIVRRTTDMETWDAYSGVLGAISITSWPGDPSGASLIVSDIGLSARLWRVPIQ